MKSTEEEEGKRKIGCTVSTAPGFYYMTVAGEDSTQHVSSVSDS